MRDAALAGQAADGSSIEAPGKCPVRPAGQVPTTTGGLPAPARCPVRPAGRVSAEVRVRRLLRVPDGPPSVGDDAAHRIFSVSILLSALRCLLTYIALPILSPLLGAATGVGPYIGIPLAVVALVFDVMGIRRFWLADHAWKWRVSLIYLLVMGFVTALLVIEVLQLVG